VIDYLQLIGTPEGERLEARERIGRAAGACRAAARDLEAAVLVISSASRVSSRQIDKIDPAHDDPRELVTVAKESGDVEHAADTMTVLVSGEYSTDAPTDCPVAIAKARARGPSWGRLVFNGSTFTEAPCPPRRR